MDSNTLGNILAIVSFGIVFVSVIVFSGLIHTGIVVIDTSNTENIDYDITSMSIDSAEDVDQRTVEDKIHMYVNEERSERNVNNVTYQEDMVEISRFKSQHMIDNNYFAHESPDGMGLLDLFERHEYDRCVSIGENLAQTYYDTSVDTNYGGLETYKTQDELAEGVVKQFIASPSHKDNLLDENWDTQSIGFELNGNEVIVTQHLCELKN